MQPRVPDEMDIALLDGGVGKLQPVLFKAPEDMGGCGDLATLVRVMEDGTTIVHVPWQPTALDLDRLQRGAPIWVSVYSGSLPPLAVEVLEPATKVGLS